MAERDPWVKFHPDDWLNDLELQTLPMDTQGVYINLLCLLLQANPPGYLLVSGVVPTEKCMGKLLRIHPNKYRRCLAELVTAKVLKVADDGTVYSARILSDREKRAKAQEAGKKGGNPHLIQEGVKGGDKGRVNPPLKLDKNKNKKESKNKGGGVNPPYTQAFESWWTEWPEKRDKGKAFRCYSKLVSNGTTPDQLLLAARNYVTDCKRCNRFLKNAATFLGPDRPWEDYLEGVPADAPASRCCGTCAKGPESKMDGRYCLALMETRLTSDSPCDKWEAR